MSSLHPLLSSTPPRPASPDDVEPDFWPRWEDRADFEVRLDVEHTAKMREDLQRAAPYRVETGGLLFAWGFHDDGHAVTISHVTGPPAGARHEADLFALSEQQVLDDMGEFTRRAVDNGMACVGHWHSHPSWNGPSREDRETWARQLRRHGHPASIGIIAYRSDDGSGWMWPTFDAFVTYQPDPDSPLLRIRRARLNEFVRL